MKKTLILGVVAMIAWSCSSPLFAADKPDKATKRAAILMQKLKQDMEAEKAALQTQLEQEKKSMTEQLNSVQSVQRSNSAKLQGQVRRNQQLQFDADRLRAEKQALESQLTQLQTQLQEHQQLVAELNQQLTDTKNALGVNDTQRKKLVSNVSNMHQKLQSCEEKNSQLYAYGKSLVSLYDDASTYQKILRQEPFFQLKRVELENLLQEKRDQLDGGKVDTIATP
ncbi:hypothetical protein [Methylophilus aquaticus]|uniref:Chromosome partition protein Smc n=1 Tax=Methylophilus aquaticus TaxID=1971610 RepID=A0ABT9JUE0_9PROT|nr:hypothetical protein [Methylophilus aquaticus]MDP8568212.1 hypothetical protein [Methylophilus aquaticus]